MPYHSRTHSATRSKLRDYQRERDEALQILFRLITHGRLTPVLSRLKPEDEIEFSGPYGEFTVRDASVPNIFVAMGTGVAPCLAYLRTRPDLNVTLLHGVRHAADVYYRDFFAQQPYFPCVSWEAVSGMYHGRVTDFWRSRSWPEGAHYHLCGSNEMIFDMQVLLREKGVSEDHIYTEAYCYRLYS